jgi:hypothetical protein
MSSMLDMSIAIYIFGPYKALIKAKTTKTSSVISKGNGFGTPKTRKLENMK